MFLKVISLSTCFDLFPRANTFLVGDTMSNVRDLLINLCPCEGFSPFLLPMKKNRAGSGPFLDIRCSDHHCVSLGRMNWEALVDVS